MARILIIDDDTRMRSLLREILADAGHEVMEAADGTTGVSAFCETRPDLAIVDIVMPGKSGVTTIGEIHQHDPDAKIIAISGGDPSGARSDLPIAWAFGASVSLRKPVGVVPLLQAVDQLI